MARDRFDYAHGDVGTEPPTALDFVSGAKPQPEYHDWFWTEVTSKINLLFDELDRLDSDDDGVVDEADYANDADASTYKGRDLDADGDGQVDAADQADNATTLQGLTPADIRTAVEDSEGVVEGDTTAISFDGDLQVTDDGDGTVTVSFTRTNDTRTDVSDDGSRVVAEADDINFGSNIDVVDDGDGTVTVTSDNTTTVKGNDIDTDGDGVVDEADQVDGFDAAQLLGGSTDNVTSIDLDAGQFTALQRFDGDDLPSGTELVVREANVTNGEHNTPNGLSVIIRDVSANTTLTTYNGLSFGITETFTVGNSDLLLAIDNGNFTLGTGTTQTNVTGHITYDLR